MKTERVKGFNDFTEEEAQKRAEIRKILVETFEKYGFQPAETPIIEYEEFVRGENEKDEAVSDIFKLKDKGKRNLMGEVFRAEPVSSNRFRQFTQCDVDVIGSTVKDEAEVLSIAFEIMKNLGIKNPMRFNN